MADDERASRGHGSLRLSDPAIALILFLASWLCFNATLHLVLELRDEGFLLYSIARVAHGEIPHRDFAEAYGPGFYALTAPLLWIFGDQVFPIRELVAVVRAAAVAFAYLIARQLVPRPFALLAALVAAIYWGRVIWNLHAPYAALFSITLGMLSLLVFLRGWASGRVRDRRRACLGSGLICGGALLFKWSLAAVSAYGMVLAICAGEMLREPGPEAPRVGRLAVLLVWASMGLAIVVPFLPTLTLFDYLLHFAPIHALVVLVAIRFARFGDAPAAFAGALPLALRYCLGFLVIPLCVGALYLGWGSLDDLLYDTLQRPFRLRNYRLPIDLPGAVDVLHLVCLVAWIGAGLSLQRGARRCAALLAALGCLLAPAAYRALSAHGNPSLALQSLMQVQPVGVSVAVLGLFALRLAGARPTGSEPRLKALVAVLLFQQLMTFQIFPRASFNVTLMLGTLAPCIAWLCYRAYGFALGGAARQTPARRLVAFTLSALLPLLFVGEIARATLASAMAPRERALHSPALAGIRPRPHPFAPNALRQFDDLMIYLETVSPPDAPVFSLPIDYMIYFASGRRHLFEDHALALFLAGWDFLPADDPEKPSQAAMIRRLRETPEAVVITRAGDRTQAHFEALFPAVSRYVERSHRVEKEIGEYRVMRLRQAARTPPK